MPRPASTPTASAPAKPTGVTFTTDSVELPGRSGTDEVTYQFTHTVTWEAPRAEGVEIRVYGVTECPSKPNSPAPGTSGPCLEDDTQPPPSVRVLAVTAPAAAGEVSWVAPFGYDCAGPPVGPEGFDYDAIVVAAYNAAGESMHAIADAGSWTRADAGEVIC